MDLTLERNLVKCIYQQQKAGNTSEQPIEPENTPAKVKGVNSKRQKVFTMTRGKEMASEYALLIANTKSKGKETRSLKFAHHRSFMKNVGLIQGGNIGEKQRFGGRNERGVY